MGEEVRQIVLDAIEGKPRTRNLAEAIRARMALLGGVELELPPRGPMREPPSLD